MKQRTLTPGLEIDVVPETGEPILGDLVAGYRGTRLSGALRDIAADPGHVADEALQYWTVVETRAGSDTAMGDEELAYSLTFMSANPLGWERPKTHGHVHADGVAGHPDSEVYEVLRGTGIFLFQDLTAGPEASVVFAVRAEEGETVVVPPFMYHASINGGDGPLVFGDVCRRGLVDVYGGVKEARGFAYYFPVDGEPVPNPNYRSVPPLRQLTAAEWSAQAVGPLYRTLRDSPERLAWLLDLGAFSEKYPQFDQYQEH